MVPFDSAQVGHAKYEVLSGINGNHLEICKYEKKSDPGYKAVYGAIEDYMGIVIADGELGTFESAFVRCYKLKC